MTAPTITGHCATCSGPVVSDPSAVLCRACWARENAAPVEDGAFNAAVDDLIAAAHTDGACGGGRSQATDDAIDALMAAHAADVAAAYAMGVAIEGEASACAGCGEPLGELCFACNDDARDPDHDAMITDRDRWRRRAELAESRLAIASERLNTVVAHVTAKDAAARAKRDRFETHPTLRDWREGQAK